MSITITEALAEIKTIGKRIEKKRESMATYFARQEGVRDPLEKNGGSAAFIAAERQAVGDLEQRLITLRRAIQTANDETSVTINSTTRTVSEWLTWRRDVAPGQRSWLSIVRATLVRVRESAQKQGNAVLSSVAQIGDSKPTDIVVNVDEVEIATAAETLEDTLGQLDGQLSLKNATVFVKI